MFGTQPIGYWNPVNSSAAWRASDIAAVCLRCREQFFLIRDVNGRIGVGVDGHFSATGQGGSGFEVLSILPPLYPEWLGSREFTELHGLRFAYVSGAMANGIASVELVEAMASSGCLGFFGSAGLSLEAVGNAIHRLSKNLGPSDGPLPWGANLIHSPNEPELEAAVADLYIRNAVRKVSAAAYMKLTPSVVRYALSGLYLDEHGTVQRKNYLFAKVSRPEVARHFMQPAPRKLVEKLLADGLITESEAELSKRVTVAEDFTVESDSGGHTDNQPLTALFPMMIELRNQELKHLSSSIAGFSRGIRLGAAGGIGSPQALAAAYALGADYAVTGSINQACVESGLDESGKELLAMVALGDVMMAPAADMFELGVEVQVLKRGTMFGVRAHKLYHFYRNHQALHELSDSAQAQLERILGSSVDDAWKSTADYWRSRDPRELHRAEREPKHKMALLFRSYLGLSSKWAIWGTPERKLDYQIWCGPAMGAFNAWVRGSFLEPAAARSVHQVALNMLEGAAVVSRHQQLRSAGAECNQLPAVTPIPRT